MKKKAFIALFLCLVIVLSLTSFTACNNDSTDHDLNYETPEDFKQAVDLMESMIAYKLEAKDSFILSYYDNTLYKDLVLSSFDNDMSIQEELKCYITNSEEEATQLASNLTEDYKEYSIFVDKNIVVCKFKETSGKYEEIRTKRFAKNKQPEPFRHVIATLNKVGDYSEFYVTFTTSFNGMGDEETINYNSKNGIFESLVEVTPARGNCSIASGIQQKEDTSDYPDWSWEQEKAEIEKHEVYTEDSFMDFITVNNVEYVRYYLKYKPRMVFEEYGDGYELTAWYYDTSVATLPATHNEKPVLDIPSISREDYCGLTDINFEGTKAQWEAIRSTCYTDRGVTIHCTDGDIAPSA